MKPKIEFDEDGRMIYSVSLATANLFALALIIPTALFMALPFFLIWGDNVFSVLKFKSLIFILLFNVLGIVIHELLHGITWAFFARGGFRAIRFGIKWAYFAPYCHCKAPLKVWQYIAGGIAPLVFMGIIPSVWAMFSGNSLLMFFGIFFTLTAAGDILSFWMLRKFKAKQLVQDHPDKLGFIFIEE